MPPTLEELRERARPWTEPVPGNAPAGVLAKHEPAYEAVSAEVAKLESPASNAVRWDSVVEGASTLLKGTTKDLWLASWLAYGLYATRGLEGAATGATVLAEVTERYWPHLFPDAKRLRARANAVSWFVDRLGRILPTVDGTTLSPQPVEALAAALKRLSEVSRERFADQAPGFGAVNESLARLRASLPAAEPTPPPAPVATPVASAPAAPTPVAAPAPVTATPVAPAPQPPALPTLPSSPDLSSAEAVTDFLRNVGTALVSAAGALRGASPTDPLAYRLLRTGLWLHLSRPPAADANGRTTLQPLPEPLRARLKTLEANARWGELLDEAESTLTQHRFALDLHRASASALAGLGDAYAAARAALVEELSTQLRRMPGVDALVAADGTPLTSEDTRAWLREQAPSRARSPRVRDTTSPPSTVAAPLSLPPPAAEEASTTGSTPALESEALALLAEGRVPEAVARLQSAITGTSAGRARFIARLTLARLCANAAQLPLARALYDALDEEVSAHGLDVWEPALAAACLEGWLSTRTAQEKKRGRLAVKVRNRYRRLARLDSSAALRVGA